MKFFIRLTLLFSHVKAFIYTSIRPRIGIQPCLISKNDSGTDISCMDTLEVHVPVEELKEPSVKVPLIQIEEPDLPFAVELLLEVTPLVVLGGLVALGAN